MNCSVGSMSQRWNVISGHVPARPEVALHPATPSSLVGFLGAGVNVHICTFCIELKEVQTRRKKINTRSPSGKRVLQKQEKADPLNSFSGLRFHAQKLVTSRLIDVNPQVNLTAWYARYFFTRQRTDGVQFRTSSTRSRPNRRKRPHGL